MIYPWQEKEWQRVLPLINKRMVPHALLITGSEGLGKMDFAKHLIHTLLCQAQTEKPCQICHACKLLAEGVHPDFCMLESYEDTHAIKVDQIRGLEDFIFQSSAQMQYKIVLIKAADHMNVNAANALLKTLEEPPPNVILILVANQISKLPATILSRCQKIQFAKPEKNLACLWLNENVNDKKIDLSLLLDLANGSPLLVLNMLKEDNVDIRETLFAALLSLHQKKISVFKLAEKIKDISPIKVIDLLMSISLDILRLQVGVSPQAILHRDYVSFLSTLIKSNEKNLTLPFLTFLKTQRELLHHGANLNKNLLFDNVLTRWEQVYVLS